MKGAPKRVFLSHTDELGAHPRPRSYVAAAEAAVAARGHAVVDMGQFTAGSESPADYCAARVRRSDVYVGLIGLRYGSPVRDKPELSYTELEYDAARDAGIPRLVFLLDEEATATGLPASAVIDRPYGHRQDAFRSRLRDDDVMCPTFDSPDRLQALVYQALVERLPPDPSPDHRRPGASVAPEVLPVFGVPLGEHRWFWDRKDLLSSLDEACHSRRAVTVALTGLGGGGKTQLAARLAYHHRGQLDVVWWVTCTPTAGTEDQRAVARARFADLGSSHLSLSADDNPDARVAAVRRWLETTDRPWLLVFDDAHDWSTIEGMIPQRGPGLSLITSRNPHWDLADAVLDVAVFDRAEAAAFLQARSGIDDPQGALALADALRGLPLALEQAAAFLAHSPLALGFASYIEALRTRGLDVFGGRVDEYPHVVTTVWEQSFDAVAERSPRAAELLELLGVLAPVPVPTTLFGGSDGAAEVDAARALDELARDSLLSAASDTVVVHPLVHQAIARRLGDEQRHVARRRAIELLAAALPCSSTNRRAPPADWPQYEALLPHVMSIAGAPPAPGEDASDLLGLLNGECVYLLSAGQRLRAVTVAETTAELATDRRRAEHPEAAEHLEALRAASNRARAYQLVGRTTEAIAIGDAVRDDRERILGPDHRDTLSSRADLVVSHQWAGNIHEAIELGMSVLEDRTRVLGTDDNDTLWSRIELGWSHLSAGHCDAAIAWFTKALADRERLRGPEDPEHPDTLWDKASLAFAYQSAERTAEATPLFEEVVHARRRVLGPRHPDTLWTEAQLGNSYRAAGLVDDAITIGEAALAGTERVLGPDHPDTLWARAYLARAYRSDGRATEALAIHEKVLADRERILGPDHPDTVTAREDVAAVYRSVGRITEALAISEQVLAERERILGPDHPDTLRARRAPHELRTLRDGAEPA